MPDPWLAMLIVAGVYMVMFAIGEVARRQGHVRADLTRKFSHVAAGGIALALPLLFANPEPVIALAGSFLVFLGVTRRAGWLGSIHAIERRSVGAFLYPVSVAAIFVIASGDYPRYAIAVLALGVGDAAGAIVGGRPGTHRYAAWHQPKTWEGSFAVLVTMIVVSTPILIVSGRPVLDAVLIGCFVGIVVALVEGALPWGLDNLGVPLAAIVSLGAAGSVVWAALLVLVAGGLFLLAVAIPRRFRSDGLEDPADRGLAHRDG